jgi:hypothetical protein
VFVKPHPVCTLPCRYEEHHVKIKTMRISPVLPNTPVVDLKMLQGRRWTGQWFVDWRMLEIYAPVAIGFEQWDAGGVSFSGHRKMLGR